MNDIKSWHELGFGPFMTRVIPSSNRLSSIGARNLIPIGGISPSRLVSPLNATTDIVFSSTDNNTAAWASGTIYFADGTNSGTMDAGNTGNISATTYVYYDKEILGVLQSTTTVANATKFNRLLIAIVETGASGKDCKITPTIAAGLNVSGITAAQITADTITAAEIEAGTITATELAADSVTADKIDVSQLDAITVNTGTLTVDESITAGGSVDGTIYVKDSSNNTKVQLDQDGITINTGKMTIKDSGETTIIDATGLVSTANFASDELFIDAADSETAATYTAITGGAMTEFTLSRTTKVMFFLSGLMWIEDSEGSTVTGFLGIDVDGNGVEEETALYINRDSSISETVAEKVGTHRTYSLSAATYTPTLKARVVPSGATATLWFEDVVCTRINLGT